MTSKDERLRIILDEAVSEIEDATCLTDYFGSQHEGYATILEKLDKLWEAIKDNRSPGHVGREAVLVAAMALQFAYDYGPGGKR